MSQIEDGGDTDMNMSITYPPLNEESETLAGRTRKKVVVTADVASTPISAMQCEEVLPGMAIKNEDDCLYQPLIQIDDVVVISDDEDERVTVKEEIEESAQSAVLVGSERLAGLIELAVIEHCDQVAEGITEEYKHLEFGSHRTWTIAQKFLEAF